MELRDGQRLGLEQLLKECSAHVASESGRGTGFFVDERHLLTASHVVGGQKGATVTVHPYTRASRQGTVVAVEEELTDDLALVDVEPVADEEPLPSVVFDRVMTDGTNYFAVGYPTGDLVQDIGIEGITYVGHPRNENVEGQPTLLKLEAGQAAVTPGMSGGPVLNTRTGAVVAIMQYRTLPDTPMGGGAIPVARAAAAFEPVRRAIDEPPPTTRRWRDVLGADAWQALGYRVGWKRMLEVRVTGSRDGWKVQVDPDDEAPKEVTTEGLPKEVFQALFSWAERRRVRDPEEVSLLGRLLAGAVFPSEAASKLLSDRLHDELLLRLHFDPGDSDLFDVPWEFVTIRAGNADRHLAAHENMGLVRVGPHPEPDKVTTAPCESEAYVLGIVIEPEQYQAMPRLSDVPWPTAGEILEGQRDAVTEPGTLWFKGLPNPTFDQLDEELAEGLVVDGQLIEDASLEVVHYIGFGRVENGRPSLAFSDGEDGIYWRPAAEFFSWVADHGARLLVVEFMLAPVAMQFEAPAPQTFLGALANRVNGIVFTRFPVHTRELAPFNKTLYAALGGNKSVEMAVQLARKKVDGLQALGDAAGFGAFSLITGEKPDMRLVPGEVAEVAEPMSSQERGPARRRVAETTRPAETFVATGR